MAEIQDIRESEIWINRGDEFINHGDLIRANECYSRALEFNTRSYTAYFKRGTVYEKSKTFSL